MRSLVLLVLSVLLSSPSTAAPRAVSFSTSQGTWMNVDVSPDGRTLVFDLLGDLYTLPIDGGTATRITDGWAHDSQPRWSPDGQWVAFTSDRSGSDNIWVVAPDGRGPRALTQEKEGGLSAPSWAPDSRSIVARRDGTYNRRGSADLWLYQLDGGTGVRLVERRDEGGLNPNGPTFSPDGRYLYFASGYRSLDSTWDPWQIWRLDRQTGQRTQVTAGYNGAVRPRPTRDGNGLLFVRRHHAAGALVLRDLQSGVQRDVYTALDRDDQRGTTDYDAFPGYALLPDDKAVVVSSGGGLQRIALDGGAVTKIPFTVAVSLEIPERPAATYPIEDGDLTARVIRSSTVTPDGRALVFEALGHVWVQRGGGAPQRLTKTTHREYTPSVSPDGKSVAWVSWDDKSRGHVWRAPIDGGEPVQLTTVARQYANPSWSPDGQRIVVAWRAPNYGNTANVPEDDPSHEIVWLPANGGPTTAVANVKPRNAGRWFPTPRFGPNGERVFFVAATSETRNDLISVRLDGTDRRSHLRFKYVEEAAPSPDGRYVAFVAFDDLWVVDMPPVGTDPIEVDLERPAMPLRRMTTDGGGYLAWTDGGRSLNWSYANVAYRQRLEDKSPVATPVTLRVPRALPQGSLLLRNARILTMKGTEVIERGDVLVTRNRITAIGRSGSVSAPPGTPSLDLTGKTIMPGIVDAHWHGHYTAQDIYPEQKWQYLADLAYGVTTGREVSAPTRDTMAQADMVEAGAMIGPRVFATGWPLFAARDGGPNNAVVVDSLEAARAHVRRLKRNGVTSLKQYLQPRREARRWLQQAALEEGLRITAEGGGYKVQTTLMLDGFSGFEHGLPVAPIYDDVIQLLARTGITYTPTLVAGYAKPGAMDYFYAHENVHEDPRASRFIPHDLLDRFTTIRYLMPENNYLFKAAARGAWAARQAGGNVAVGGHGNHPGLGPHWEMWAMVEGGWPAADVLRAATLGGAEALGIEKDAGSLEVGKLADMIVLDADPRRDIRASTSVFRVIKNGQVHTPDDLAAMLPWH